METWDGDGHDTFLASLAEGFRGWEGARTWHSVCYDLTLSAEHRPGHSNQARELHFRGDRCYITRRDTISNSRQR
ncbi:DUF6228 family protein [Streptomyces sp. NPDC056309]|uniref:DUF6228 family protein n=1 Tax=unclassified Streptomyces TaxID=2593676 RepID=UPI0035E1E86B